MSPAQITPASRAEDRLRRLLLQAAMEDARVQDLVDSAEAALEIGLKAAAGALYGLVFLQLGFAPAAAALRSRVDERTGLWGLPAVDPAPPLSTFTVDAAVAELRRLVTVGAKAALTPFDISGVLAQDSVVPALIAATERRLMLETADRVVALLIRAPRLQLDGGLGDALRREVEAVLTAPEPGLEGEVDQPIEIFVALFVLGQVRQFLVTRRHLLLAAPPAVFEEASLLDPAALGAFFSHVPLVLRDVGDLFGLIEAAAPGDVTTAQIETWAVLLSSGFDRAALLSLVDELADRGMIAALQAILVRLALGRRTQTSLEVAWRLRDCAIDIGAWGLATEAQRLVIRCSPFSPGERMVLGEILQSQGAMDLAESAYRSASLLGAGSTRVAARLLEVRSGVPSVLAKGYGTSKGRHLLRRARLKAHGVSVDESPVGASMAQTSQI
jgi:hypothetical protein